MIPNFVTINSEWKVLPPGIHEAAMDEIERRFATNEKRKVLFEGFKRGVDSLMRAGCKTIFLDGSFVTDKPKPGDFDVCWDPTGVDEQELDPVLLDFRDNRRAQKLKYGGDFFPSSTRAKDIPTILSSFQMDKNTMAPKGIIRLIF